MQMEAVKRKQNNKKKTEKKKRKREHVPPPGLTQVSPPNPRSSSPVHNRARTGSRPRRTTSLAMPWDDKASTEAPLPPRYFLPTRLTPPRRPPSQIHLLSPSSASPLTRAPTSLSLATTAVTVSPVPLQPVRLHQRRRRRPPRPQDRARTPTTIGIGFFPAPTAADELRPLRPSCYY